MILWEKWHFLLLIFKSGVVPYKWLIQKTALFRIVIVTQTNLHTID